MNVLDLQRRLSALGFDPGPLDGVWGRRTIAALTAFQRTRGLVPDAIVGPKTLAALGAASGAVALEPPWLIEARRWIGLTEIAGPRSNARILAWGQAIADWYRDDDTPWCGAFVHGQIAATLPEEPLPANALQARAWASFGVALSRPAPGAVLVFSRTGGGHVGFYVGEDTSRFRVLGGNQSNAVNESWIAKSRLLAIRWPKSFAAPAARAVLIAAGGPTSRNEA